MRSYKIIAVDFDGTLCKHAFPGIGPIQEVNQRVINYVRNRKQCGDIIILWTCRANTEERKYLDEAVEFCKKNNIPIDYVNENCPEMKLCFGCDTRKIVADMYIDDLAININHIMG